MRHSPPNEREDNSKMIDSIFKKSLIVAITTDSIDFLFHFFLTNPMESLTYFVVKFLLAFFIASGMFSLETYSKRKNKGVLIVIITGFIFSTLMSTYYRAWELFEEYAPFGSRAPDILGVQRESLLFPALWWIGHASFFVVGVIISEKLVKGRFKHKV